MVWKQRALWALVSMIAAAVASWVVLRRFETEIGVMRDDMEKQTRLIQQALITVRNGINAHG